MRILLSSVGRRGYLVKFFRQAATDNDRIWGGDNSKYAPALHYCDRRVLLPPVNKPDYVDMLIRYCKTNQIDMVVPLIDPELEVLSAERYRFYSEGIMVVVSPPDTIRIAFDKYLTYKFCKANDISVPETVLSVEDAMSLLNSGKLKWPLVVKPRNGSASADITYCHDQISLSGAFQACPQPMIQEFVKGDEYGFDIFADRDHTPISVFCKKKLAMRAGETDKAVSTNDPMLIDFGLKITQSMELFGPVDVDVIVDDRGPKLLEINPRFGGGYPCSHLAGANFPAKLIAIARGEKLKPDIGSCPAGVCMLKQDEIISPNLNDMDSL